MKYFACLLNNPEFESKSLGIIFLYGRDIYFKVCGLRKFARINVIFQEAKVFIVIGCKKIHVG